MVSVSAMIQALMPTPMEAAISLAIIGVGMAVIPTLAFFQLLRPKGWAGRILWTIAAIVLGPYGLIQNDNGGYGLHSVRRDDDDDLYAMVDGKRVDIQEQPENWTRLGKQPFFITYRKSERLFRDVLSDVGDALPDGGLDGQRGGYHSYVPDRTDDGYLIRVHRLLERLREAGGSRLADIAEEEGLREFGGDKDMGNLLMIGYVSSMAILGLLGGVYLFG